MRLHTKKPTIKQSAFLRKHGINAEKWLVAKDNAKYIMIIRRDTARRIKIEKDG